MIIPLVLSKVDRDVLARCECNAMLVVSLMKY